MVARFNKDFSHRVQIRRKFHFAITQILREGSPEYFVHVTIVMLLWPACAKPCSNIVARLKEITSNMKDFQPDLTENH